ncbi:acylphosphatase [Virgibacillus flavescens]|uniref:acylphosphatase n=1 Tax=Virgibacillus flavescens TaxID=1611422 RepID=UPI003D3276B0
MIKHISVNGLVQGVGFRFATKQKADSLDLRGWVKNMENGTVQIQVEGQEKQIETFISSIKDNPTPVSRVEHIEVKKVDHVDHMEPTKDFLIK